MQQFDTMSALLIRLLSKSQIQAATEQIVRKITFVNTRDRIRE